MNNALKGHSGLLSAALVSIVIAGLLAGRAVTATTPNAAHGKYLVNQVGMCIDCHGHDLKGAPLPFKAIDESIPFVPVAPNIRGKATDHYTQAQLASLLSNAKRPNGAALLPPMPPYKMNKYDAESVAIYLKSLK